MRVNALFASLVWIYTLWPVIITRGRLDELKTAETERDYWREEYRKAIKPPKKSEDIELDEYHLQLINLLLSEGKEIDCDDERLDQFGEDRGASTDTINGLMDAGLVRQLQYGDDLFNLQLASKF